MVGLLIVLDAWTKSQIGSWKKEHEPTYKGVVDIFNDARLLEKLNRASLAKANNITSC